MHILLSTVAFPTILMGASTLDLQPRCKLIRIVLRGPVRPWRCKLDWRHFVDCLFGSSAWSFEAVERVEAAVFFWMKIIWIWDEGNYGHLPKHDFLKMDLFSFGQEGVSGFLLFGCWQLWIHGGKPFVVFFVADFVIFVFCSGTCNYTPPPQNWT